MCHSFLRDARFWSLLLDIDRDIAEEARRGRCSSCGGPLHRAHYRRKPRGVDPQVVALEFVYRLSFCCGQEGCRRRLTPPSVRFLGPKVYLGAIVVLVTALRQGPSPQGLRKLASLFGADRRTISRWQKLWQEVFPLTKFWRAAKAHFMPTLQESQLPYALLESFEGPTLEAKLQAALRFLSPITISEALLTSAF